MVGNCEFFWKMNEEMLRLVIYGEEWWRILGNGGKCWVCEQMWNDVECHRVVTNCEEW